MRALDGRRAHLTHVQFHSYGGSPDDQAAFRSEVPALVDHVNAHPEPTVDVGQVLFGETTSMTGDGPLGYPVAESYLTHGGRRVACRGEGG
jgi:formylmethanofuran dehydrogenase subunit A